MTAGRSPAAARRPWVSDLAIFGTMLAALLIAARLADGTMRWALVVAIVVFAALLLRLATAVRRRTSAASEAS